MSIKVFLVDDHAVLRDGLRLMLETESDIRVVGDAANGQDAIRGIQLATPDVALIDIAMPEMNGFELTRHLHEAFPTVRVVILSVYSTVEQVLHGLRAGAMGYLLKETAGEEVIDAVRAVYLGRHYLSAPLREHMKDMSLDDLAAAENPLQRLSEREQQVLRHVVDGKSSAEIAEILYLSPRTVDTYRSRLMQKLGIADLAGLVKFAIQQGLISLDQ